MREVIEFLEALRLHNDKEWFDANKDRYMAAKERFDAFVGELIGRIASFDQSVADLTPRDCTYRIYRDLRFTSDKTPYKTHMSAFIAPHGKNGGYGGYYLHVEPEGSGMLGGCLLCTGIYMPQATVLKSLREEVMDNGAAMRAAIEKACGFQLDHGRAISRNPLGFPSDTDYDDLLRLKDYLLDRPIDRNYLTAPDAIDRVAGDFAGTTDFLTIVNRAVKYAYDEMM